jgi:hypothetical protein
MFTILIVAFILYWVPLLIVLIRHPANGPSIIAISLLLGWLPFISLICVIWAVVAKKPQPRKFQLIFK